MRVVKDRMDIGNGALLECGRRLKYTVSVSQSVPACIGSCRLCSQGRLLIAKDTATRTLYIFCEECESEWESPEESRDSDLGTQDRFGVSTFLDRVDLRGHPWERFLE